MKTHLPNTPGLETEAPGSAADRDLQSVNTGFLIRGFKNPWLKGEDNISSPAGVRITYPHQQEDEDNLSSPAEGDSSSLRITHTLVLMHVRQTIGVNAIMARVVWFRRL